MTNYGLTKMSAHNKGVQSDSAPCHALCVPHKDAPACYAVDAGVIRRNVMKNTKENIEKYGWEAMFVFDENEKKEPFLYTIGLEETFSHP